MLKVLLIGGTGIISKDITLLASRKDNVDLYLLNRGQTPGFLPDNVKIIQADINDAETVQSKTKGLEFDVVCDFISYGVDSLSRKIDTFRGRCGQYRRRAVRRYGAARNAAGGICSKPESGIVV